jgi:DinB family protein
MGETRTGDVLIEHYRRTFVMLRDAIAAFPEDGWRTSDIDHLAPARHALHVIAAVDMYFRPEYVKGVAGGNRFGEGLDWEGSPAEKMPSQQELLDYLDEMAGRVKEWLGVSDDELLKPVEAFGWTGGTLLARALYVLRHNHHHQGILDAELRRRNIARPKWR